MIRRLRCRCSPTARTWARSADRWSAPWCKAPRPCRSEEHTSELQSLMRISYAVFCLKKKTHDPSTTEKRTTTAHTHATAMAYKLLKSSCTEFERILIKHSNYRDLRR